MSVSLPDGRVIDYIHDPLGRRIAKKVDGVITEKYLWQGLTRLLAVYDGSDSLLMRFEYADARMPVAMTRGGTTYYLTYDQVGSLRVVTDSSGNVVKRVDYDSFGNITGDANPTFTIPFGFARGLHDRDTGLVRFGFRDYDPDVGRWTAKDPIGFWGGDVDLYGYCLNDPINWVDPSGLLLQQILGQVQGVFSTGGLGAVIGAAVGGVAGGIAFGPPGAIGGGILGGFVGSLFDPLSAGQLNYGEESMIRLHRNLEALEPYHREWKELAEKLEEWNRRTGGWFDVSPCEQGD